MLRAPNRCGAAGFLQGISVCGLVADKIYVRVQNAVDKLKERRESDLRTIASEGKKEGCSGRRRSIVCFELICDRVSMKNSRVGSWAHTDGDSKVLDWIRFPLFLLNSVEAELREDVRRHQSLEVRLQHRPCRLRLNASVPLFEQIS
jgi:hypothetical protein